MHRGITRAGCWFRLAVVVISLVAVVPSAAHAAPRKGGLAVTLVTPKGVPATALVRKRAVAVAVAKGPSGTTRSTKLAVAPGIWRVIAAPVLFADRFYVPTARPAAARVKAGKVVKVRVVWKLASTARALRLTDLQRTSIRLAFTRPSTLRKVAIRYAAGTVAPKSVTSGKGAAVSGSTAVASGLSAGAAYSFGLFTKVGARWVGPLTITATTLPAGRSGATYVTNPDTLLVAAGARLGSRQLADGTVRTRLPAGVTPVIGAPVVLPLSASLPGGFVGEIVGVGADGTATLEQAPLADAFDYLKVSLPDLGAVATVQKVAVWSPSPPDGRTPRASLDGCDASAGFSVKVDPSISFDGTFSIELATKKHFGIPTSAGLRSHVRLVATVSATVDASVKAAYSCGATLGTSTLTFMAGPVPMMIRYSPKAEVSVTGKIAIAHAGYALSAGIDANVYVPTVGLGAPDIAVTPVADAHPLEPTVDAPEALSVTVEGRIGGELAFGPGLGNGALNSGIQAGISGALYPLAEKVEVSSDGTRTCLETSVGGNAALALFAKAWLPGYSIGASWDIFSHDFTYAGPWKFPEACDPPLTLPDSDLGATPLAQHFYVYPIPTSGGKQPLSFTVIGGALPPGLTVTEDGAISGRPTQVGLYHFIVQVRDADGTTASGTLSLRVTDVDSWSGTITFAGSATRTCQYSNSCEAGFSETRHTDVELTYTNAPGTADGTVYSGDDFGKGYAAITRYAYDAEVTAPGHLTDLFHPDPCTYHGSIVTTATTGTVSASVQPSDATNGRLAFGMDSADDTDRQVSIADNGDVCYSSGAFSLTGDYNGQDIVYGGLGLCSNATFGYSFPMTSLLRDIVENNTTKRVLRGSLSIPCTDTGDSGAVTITFDLTFHQSTEPSAAMQRAGVPSRVVRADVDS